MSTPTEEIDDVICEKETPKALLIVHNGIKTWVPKSVVAEDEGDVHAKGDAGTMVVARWFAEREGLG